VDAFFTFVLMRVIILGNNSALPAFGRHPSAQAVTVYGEVLLLDCGEGTQLQMQRYGVKWKNVNHIYISHMHGDHYFGLPGLINSMSLLGRTAPLYIYGPAPLKIIIDTVMSAADSQLSYPLHFHALPQGAAIITTTPTYTVQCFPVEHSITCHGFLITTRTRGRRILPDECARYDIPSTHFESLKQGNDYTAPDGTVVKNEWVTADGPIPRRYAYCADTIHTESFLPYIKGADAMYHEATYLSADTEKATARFHSTAAQAAMLARKANVRKLILGHFSSRYKDLEPFRQEAEAVFPGTIISVEGIAYNL